jgi:hypothetical protein
LGGSPCVPQAPRTGRGQGLPLPLHGRIYGEVKELELASVLAVWCVDEDHNEVLPVSNAGSDHIGSLVLPRVPSGNAEPAAPAGHLAVAFQPATELIKALVLLGWVVNHEHDQVEGSVAVEIGNGNPGTLVLP